MEPTIKIKRVYEKPLKRDGIRVLVDRLWPRGISKDDIMIVDWAKLLAPSTGLRVWYGHDPALWNTFQRYYLSELKKNKSVDQFVEKYKNVKTITLLYAAKDTEHTHAIVLQKYLQLQFSGL